MIDYICDIDNEPEIQELHDPIPNPVIEEFDLPKGHPLHNSLDAPITPCSILRVCGCGFFGHIMSYIKQCPNCKIELKGKK